MEATISTRAREAAPVSPAAAPRSHSSNRSLGQVLTTRSAGIPASRAIAREKRWKSRCRCGVGVAREGEEAAGGEGRPRERRREVLPLGAAVDLDGDAPLRGRREDAVPARLHAGPHVVEAPLRVAEDGDARRLDGPDEARRLVLRGAQVRVDRGDRRRRGPGRPRGSRRSSRPRRCSPRRRGTSRTPRRSSRSAGRARAPARRSRRRERPAGHGAVAGVVGQEGVAVAAEGERAVEVAERDLPVGAVGVEVDVAAQVGERDPVGRGEDPVDVGPREELALPLAGGVLAVEEGGEPVARPTRPSRRRGTRR